MKKKILSIILAVVMTVGMIPLSTTTVFAEAAHTHNFACKDNGNGTHSMKCTECDAFYLPEFEVLPYSYKEEYGEGYSFTGTNFKVSSNISGEGWELGVPGMFGGSEPLKIEALDPSLIITGVDAVVSFYGDYYEDVGISSGEKLEQGGVADGTTVHVTGINANTFSFAGGYSDVLFTDITVHYAESAPHTFTSGVYKNNGDGTHSQKCTECDAYGGPAQEEVLPYTNVEFLYDYSFTGTDFKVTASDADGDGMSGGTDYSVVNIESLDPSIIITDVDAVVGQHGWYYDGVGISGGKKLENGTVANNSTIHITGIYSNTFSFTGGGDYIQLKDITVHYYKPTTAHTFVNSKCVCGYECSHNFVDGICTICGKDTTFVIDENNVLTGYTGKGGDIVIPEGVTAIGKEAFRNNKTITSVKFPESLTSIGQWAFLLCSNLVSVTIPGNVKTIGNAAFSNCDKLADVTIEDGVESIEVNAFYYCSALTSIELPDSVTSMGDNVFSYCKGLKDVTLPNGITKIPYCLFNCCTNLENVTIPDSITEIENSAFYCTGIKNITIPDSVKIIGNSAFIQCESLESIVLPKNLEKIENKAFYMCRELKSITIPETVTSIGSNAFANCFALKSVTISDKVTSIGSSAFRDSTLKVYVTCDSDVDTVKNAIAATGNTTSTFEQLAHNFVDGVCSVCSYECKHNFENYICTVCGTEDAAGKLADAKTAAIAKINTAKTEDNKTIAENAITEINAATKVDDVATIKTKALTDMAKADADAAAKALADAKTAAKAAIDTAAGEDIAENVKAAAKTAKDAIDAETVTTIEAVNDIKTAAVTLIGNLKAFNAEKAVQTAAAEALAADGDSEAATALITKAKEDIAGLAYDETKTLDENKAALAAIVTKLGTDLAAQRFADVKTAAKAAIDTAVGEDTSKNVTDAATAAKNAIDAETVTTVEAVNDIKTAAVTLIGNLKAFNTEAANQIAAVEAMAEKNDSTVSQKLITDAEAEIEALTYDEGKSLNDNKAAIAAIVTKLGTALAAQRLADAKAAAIKEITDKLSKDTSELAKQEAQKAIEAIEKAESIDDVTNEKENAVEAVEVLGSVNVKTENVIADPVVDLETLKTVVTENFEKGDEIVLTVGKAVNEEEIKAVTEFAGDFRSLDTIDITLKVNGKDITEVDGMLVITLEGYALTDKKNIEVIRTHDGVAERIPTKENAEVNGEYFEIEGNNIILHINKLCTFAVTYQNELQETKQEAVEEILAALPENATEELKAEAEEAKAAIDAATTVEEVEAAKNAGLEKMEDARGRCPYCGMRHEGFVDWFACSLLKIAKYIIELFDFLKPYMAKISDNG